MSSEFRLGRWIARSYRAAHVFMAERLREYGIGYGQFPFLAYVGRHDGECQETISRDLFYDKGTTARSLARLEAAGLVTRQVSPTDRRRHRVFITGRGRKALLRLDEVLDVWNSCLTEGLTAAEAAACRALMERVANNAQRCARDPVACGRCDCDRKGDA